MIYFAVPNAKATGMVKSFGYVETTAIFYKGNNMNNPKIIRAKVFQWCREPYETTVITRDIECN